MSEPLFTDDEAAGAPPASVDSASSASPATSTVSEGIATVTTEASRPRPFRHFIDLLHDLTIAVVICALLITYVVQAFKVQGTSMAPGLVDRERILVNKFVYDFRSIERGDVVVFWYTEDPDVSFIKRVIGLPVTPSRS